METLTNSQQFYGKNSIKTLLPANPDPFPLVFRNAYLFFLKKKKIPFLEFLLSLSGLGTQHSLPENVGSIPGLNQGVEDSALP